MTASLLAFFFIIMICLPLFFLPWWQVLTGFVLAVLTVGLATGIVFIWNFTANRTWTFSWKHRTEHGEQRTRL
jgi:hypothetical protein